MSYLEGKSWGIPEIFILYCLWWPLLCFSPVLSHTTLAALINKPPDAEHAIMDMRTKQGSLTPVQAAGKRDHKAPLAEEQQLSRATKGRG